MLTIGELKNIIKDMPDDLPVRIQLTKFNSASAFFLYRDVHHAFGDAFLMDASGGQYKPKTNSIK